MTLATRLPRARIYEQKPFEQVVGNRTARSQPSDCRQLSQTSGPSQD